MITFKLLTECTMEQVVHAWNVGFEGYFFDATTDVEKFLHRMVAEGLSPKLSIVAFSGDDPIGIVLSGVRVIDGNKIAWNGGTGVAKAYRKQGIGKKMMEKVLEIYAEERVSLATLEAISENDRAISLYESLGYKIVDELEYLELNDALVESPVKSLESFQIHRVLPQQAAQVSFYKGSNPWQTQWQSAKGGEAIVLANQAGEAEGYAFYRRTLNEDGKHVATVLFQCEANAESANTKEIIESLLFVVFGSFNDSIKRVIPNMPIQKSKVTLETLKSLGFRPTVKQVFMEKVMNKNQ